MTGDLAEDVHGDARVGHPGEPGVPEVVADQVGVTEFGHQAPSDPTPAEATDSFERLRRAGYVKRLAIG